MIMIFVKNYSNIFSLPKFRLNLALKFSHHTNPPKKKLKGFVIGAWFFAQHLPKNKGIFGFSLAQLYCCLFGENSQWLSTKSFINKCLKNLPWKCSSPTLTF